MKEYHKIKTVFKRDPDTNNKTLLEGQYSLPEFEYLKDNTWVFTEKIDGTNIRIKWEGGLLSYGGKTDNAQIPTFLYDKLNQIFSPPLFELDFPDTDVCFYGEGYGAKIQKGGGYIPDGVDFILFDVRVGDWWLKRKDVEEIAEKHGLRLVPLWAEGTLRDAIEIVRGGSLSLIGKCKAEGLVMRPKTELQTRSGHRIITKIKHKDFTQK